MYIRCFHIRLLCVMAIISGNNFARESKTILPSQFFFPPSRRLWVPCQCMHRCFWMNRLRKN